MRARRLRMLGFRNYEEADITFADNVTLLCGRNAQGKTNVLEAVTLLCTGRSHRTPRDQELIRFGASKAQVRLDVEKDTGRESVEMALFREGTRRVLLNGAPVKRIGELMGHVNGVLFSPEDLQLVKSGPAERRRFMDMELSQVAPAYFYALQRYQRALKQRNALLKELPLKPVLRATLPEWDRQLAEAGAPILRWRRRFLEECGQIAAELHGAISGGECLLVRYESGAGEQDSAEALLQALEKARAQDERRCTTSVGPHRDDIALEVDGQDARVYASQGQQRTCALALKLSQVRWMERQTGEKPVLMLDDVMSELDEKRRVQLLEAVSDVQAIVTMTSAEQNLWPGSRVYEVEDGRVRLRED